MLPFLTRGCNESAVCYILTPTSQGMDPDSPFFISAAALNSAPGYTFPDQIEYMSYNKTIDTTNDWDVTYAVWSPVNPVPVPAAVWLFGSGLIGLVGLARHNKA